MYNNPTTQRGDESVRYALVQKGKRTLFVIGLNPSTADKDEPDQTMHAVMRIAEYNGFDGFIMLNLYPKRETHPKELPEAFDARLHQTNLAEIKELLKGRDNVEVWLAYGNNIARRPYLTKCLKDIVKVFEPHHPKWYYIHKLTAKGHPRHPLYQKADYLKEF